MNISTEAMIQYLQRLLNDFEQEKERYGIEDRIVVKKFDTMIACKEMAEALIGEPINLQQDGRVTIGFN